MFHPIRPLVRWSRVDIRRANANGGSYVVENVTPKPSRSVTAAIAGTSSSGSRFGLCRPSRSAVSGPPRKTSYAPITSARKMPSKPPCSSSRASSSQ